MIIITNAAGEHHLQEKNSSCIPAEHEPVYSKWGDCHPLIKLDKPVCEHYGFKLDKYVKVLENDQQVLNNQLWGMQKQFNQIEGQNISTSLECIDQLRFPGCYYAFAGCDRSTSLFKPKKICKESCLHFTKECSAFVKVWKAVYLPTMLAGNPSGALFNCVEKPSRNAEDTPECMHYDRKESLEQEDCLYLNGSSYHGNISVTVSGIPCQLWTDQCPHRHTMNNTYPELNNAKNYCRNPQNSGQRPWCFTTDRNKRWEYCDIPKCIPVDGRYGNWSLNSSCSVTCGEGFETWSRECNNPEPKYSGRNCSHQGEPVDDLSNTLRGSSMIKRSGRAFSDLSNTLSFKRVKTKLFGDRCSGIESGDRYQNHGKLNERSENRDCQD
ncbi:angiopoietin-1 receptor-like [Paramuricea clavata]|uniref:Angiopoietin-1 receptor-like n=1 Tax=Paramuricea clavata TaxID=317549 RepID=A0A7D9DSR1_PARCT|nr:angiopoietin-1 receptor-like [Paramuricea clavata]